MRRNIESLQGKIAFGIITIREDEAEAVLDRFEVPDNTCGRADYDIGALTTLEGAVHQFALVRCLHTGQAQAQRAAHDLIEDLAPSLILLVGIGGAVPSKDFTLGDVVCATRVHDFCVVAALEELPDELDIRGGPMHWRVEQILGRLPALLRKASLKGWHSGDSIGCELPHLVVPPEDSDRYYGSDPWKKDVRESLEYHFPQGKQPRPRLVTARPVASSDALVKDTKTVQQWRQAARALAAVEMELAGVYIAARGDSEVPILAVRGISDIVGFKRGEEWTKFACHSAAAFAFALVKSGELDHWLQPVKVTPGRQKQAAMGKFNVQNTGDIHGLAQGDNQQVTMNFGKKPEDK
jgi:nucleoside phosphorylase